MHRGSGPGGIVWDDALILTTFLKVESARHIVLSPDESLVLAAVHRAVTALHDATPAEVRDYLAELGLDGQRGLAANVKGILHEMRYVQLENTDGDHVFASLFEDTNHPDTDVLLHNLDTGALWEIQLKATDSESLVQDWLHHHPHGEILVTSELAHKMGLASSGLSNHDLQVSVDHFLDRLDDIPPHDSFWRHLPILTMVSASIVVWGLWRRHQAGEMDLDEFRRRAAWATGLRFGRIVLLGWLLSVPVVGPVTGAVLVARFLVAVDRAISGNAPRPWSGWFSTQRGDRPAAGACDLVLDHAGDEVSRRLAGDLEKGRDDGTSRT